MDRQRPGGPNPLVLVVDDEPDLVRGLCQILSNSGFRVATASDGEEALAVFRAVLPAIVVLDLMLPGKDGLEVCRELRRVSDVPILILTARDDTLDKILGLELGADDYVTKPFHGRELVARLRSVLRRSNRQYPGVTLSLDGGRVRINLGAQTVTVAGQPVTLTPTEFALLVHLARHPGRVFSREELLEQVWGYDFPGDLRTVDVHVRRLRQKIEADPANPVLLCTRFGVGYVLVTS
ncbi:MAG: response regulator transcription factor [Clostridia bacterium]|nr:MAG: response regulator transcription factor [Clostridia bacterium]